MATRDSDRSTTSEAAAPGYWQSTFKSLRHRNFQFYCLGVLVSLTGTLMQQVVVAWLAYQMTGSRTAYIGDAFAWLSNPEEKDVSIDLCDESGKPVVRWKATKAMPVKMDAPSFSAAGTDIAIETIELIAHRLTLEHL